MTKRIANARMVMNGGSYHGRCHLIELAELCRQRAGEVVAAEFLGCRGQGVAIVSHIMTAGMACSANDKEDS